jgi:hypothetical protein
MSQKLNIIKWGISTVCFHWVEYGLKQSKNELGWADFRVTDYAQIQKWWEVVMSAYLTVSLHSASLYPQPNFQEDNRPSVVVKKFSLHPWWDEGTGWKNLLNNLRLVLQPFVLFPDAVIEVWSFDEHRVGLKPILRRVWAPFLRKTNS